jgi:hypothetical protein
MPDLIVNILCAEAWGAVMVMGAMWQKQVGGPGGVREDGERTR